ncbi:hypothetical protein Thein_1732 [Thermodesulfatator indicus DSM 15286]|uniref:Prepilin-type N-terminal cleavage/methylation domain-containing protein n=1 Tax=Thermodesulfatator indicus (strain DSM 15286 / JCM 11887 / CIR29812) TaxID=667014 RepID=F8ABJ3_THEID|nr:prepilin-type N-terminal cleavage/methylation domain-containing protein [Thermodesulfatator indicus]AEH45590.1 hypothetical protein Thein_1732 [Thermodesulfatator indicus DSM 15286]
MKTKHNKKGLTLVELLVAMIVSLLVIMAGTIFWIQQNKITAKVIDKTYAEQVVFQIAEIISSDLRKAGYGNPPDPIEYSNGILTIEYVDYEEPTCENETWNSTISSCNTTIKYKLEDYTLKRDLNGSGFQAMNDPQKIKINTFDITTNSTEKTVEFKIEAEAALGNFTITNKVYCRNWK